MLLGGGVWQGAGVGGGMSSATAAVVNDVPRASRSAASAYFARMDVRRAPPWRLRRRAAATAGGGNDVALVAARAGVGRSDES
jgi:hypothetical protein